jgi:hypothetical protein
MKNFLLAVRPELVEGLSFFLCRLWKIEGQCFDKLSTNGEGRLRRIYGNTKTAQ